MEADVQFFRVKPNRFGGHKNKLDGVLAQLVERLVRNEKVRGSNPLGSTIQFGGFIGKTLVF